MLRVQKWAYSNLDCNLMLQLLTKTALCGNIFIALNGFYADKFFLQHIDCKKAIFSKYYKFFSFDIFSLDALPWIILE